MSHLLTKYALRHYLCLMYAVIVIIVSGAVFYAGVGRCKICETFRVSSFDYYQARKISLLHHGIVQMRKLVDLLGIPKHS